MATKVTVELPDPLYQRTRQFAHLHYQDLEQAISVLLEQALSAQSEEELIDWTEPDPAVDREMWAYIAMYPRLRKHHFGHYVAIFQGKLVDFDDDPTALMERIEEKYPEQYVWVSQVGEEPIQTIVVRSPRLEQVAVEH